MGIIIAIGLLVNVFLFMIGKNDKWVSSLPIRTIIVRIDANSIDDLLANFLTTNYYYT